MFSIFCLRRKYVTQKMPTESSGTKRGVRKKDFFGSGSAIVGV